MDNLQIATELGLSLHEYCVILAFCGALLGFIMSLFLLKTLQY